MGPLNFPQYRFNIKDDKGGKKIFDRLRKKFVALQPEELVRQNMVEWLINEKGYPENKMANEVVVTINGMQKRCDGLVYSKDFEPLMIIEYKSPVVSITQEVFDQILTYNTKLEVDYILVSNGLQHICCRIADGKVHFLKEIPMYKDLL
ncbi:MAG: type I restriction enzyme HsdR N-terminal domain-containing protein [Paludibacteraceae bacterium]|nr:type I restriction enzyme HsdR N-terminal domain-containing protein [Paludibacteraceae bacterium]MBO7337350.1 type I restriction enzyme HsdR N-terminal domain-containing protein [Paludibacteraceae bacterium]MBP5136150.1 type I restriction enzyme HsdR N-terminal domain-containing protein [Paludibacteraceae bacterium]